jgi:hypothetical protein
MYHFPCEDLKISNCDTSGEELTLLLSFLPHISKLRISYCNNITGLGVSVTENVETVCGEEQQQIRDLAEEGLLFLPLQLQELVISNCPKVSLLYNPPHDDHIGEVGLQRLCSLRVLTIHCHEFLSSYSSSSFCLFPTSLQDLTLDGLKRTETLTNLTSLRGVKTRGLMASSCPQPPHTVMGLYLGFLHRLRSFTATGHRDVFPFLQALRSDYG